MKGIYYILLLCCSMPLFAQLNVYNVGEGITIIKGTTVFINGDFTHGEQSKGIANGGDIYLKGNLEYNANDSLFLTDEGRVVFCGDSIQSIIGSASIVFHDIDLDNQTNDLHLYQSIKVNDSLRFVSGNVFLNSFDIELNSTGKLVDESNHKRIYGRSGEVKATRVLENNLTDISGLGISIESSISLGNSRIHRFHNSQSGASTGGILRYFKIDVNSSKVGQVLDKVTVEYFDTTEVNNLEEAKFSLWKSQNNGIVWHKENSLPIPGADYVSANNVTIDSTNVLFTLAESECVNVPQVEFGMDTLYLCTTDSVVLDAQNKGLFFRWSNGSTNQTITVKKEGQFHVTVTDVNGCVGNDTIRLIEKPFPIVDFKANSVCQNFTSVFENISTISQDTMDFTWDFGVPASTTDTSSFAQGSYVYDTAGLYIVSLKAVSSFGCEVIINKKHRVNVLPEAIFTVGNECFGDTVKFVNDSKVVSFLDGANYVVKSYLWDFGEVGSLDTSTAINPGYVFSEVNSDTVLLTVVTNAGCKDSVSEVITTYPRANASFLIDSVCFGNDINVQNLTTIASGIVKYSWQFGDGLTASVKEPQKKYLKTGDFMVQMKAETDNNCLDSAQHIAVIYELPKAQFVINDTCENSFLTLKNNSTISGTDILTYEWDWDDNSNSIEESPTKAYSNFAEYEVKLVVTSENQCKDSITISTEIFATPIVDFSLENVCQGEEVRFLNSSSISDGSGVNYLWDFDLGVVTSSLKSPLQQFDAAGIYDINLNITSLKGCENSLSKSLEVYSLPSIDLDKEIGTCTDSYTLNVGGSGEVFVWSDNSQDSMLVVSNSGRYSVLVTDSNGCQSRASTTVSLDSKFTPSLGDDQSVCDNVSLDASNVGSKSYLWSTGETTRTISVSKSDEYSVEIVDQNDCIGKDTIVVTVNSSPIVELGDKQSFCKGGNITVDAGGDLGSTYRWSHGDSTQAVVLDSSGVYSVTVTNQELCFSSDNIQVEVFDLPFLNLGDDRLICDSLTLSVSDDWSNYLWSNGSKEASLFVNSNGMYWLEITDVNSCVNSDSINITIVESPKVSLGDDISLCSQQTVLLNAGNFGDEYLWITKDTVQQIEVSSSGIYTVSVTNEFGCVGTDEINVNVEPNVDVSLGDDRVICKNQEIIFDAKNRGGKYNWNSNIGFNESTREISVSDSGLYWVEVITPGGCVGRDTVHVFVVDQELKPDFVAVSSLLVGDTVQFVNVSETEGLTHNWNFDDGVISISEDPVHIFLNDGDYNVSLAVSNGVCSESISKLISVFVPRQIEDTVINTSFYNQIVDADLYPNPVQELLYLDVKLEIEGELLVVIYGVEGKKMMTDLTVVDKVKKVYDVTTLPNGVYILKVMIANDTKLFRFVKF